VCDDSSIDAAASSVERDLSAVGGPRELIARAIRGERLQVCAVGRGGVEARVSFTVREERDAPAVGRVLRARVRPLVRDEGTLIGPVRAHGPDVAVAGTRGAEDDARAVR